MAPLISKKKGSLLDSVDMTNVSSTQKVVLPVGTPTQTPMTKSVPTSNKQTANQDEWTEDLIKHINKEAGEKIAFNLTIDEAPTNIKRWISTGSEQLNYIIKNNSEGGLPEGRIIELQGPPSCHGYNEEILMYDGSIRKVQDVNVGDNLMGPDSKPRKVLKKHEGTTELYEVINGWKDKLIFTANHELALIDLKEQVHFIKIEDYHKLSATKRKEYKWFQPKNGISFDNDIQLNVDPYSFITQKKSTTEELNFIPKDYLLSSREDRLELLAGLIDTDGHTSKDKRSFYEYVTKSPLLKRDVEFLARSLGYKTTVTEKFVNDNKYYRIYISGETLFEVPVRLPRKKLEQRTFDKRMNTTFFKINKLDKGKYVGFTVDQDNLYLNSKLSVIKNCGKSHVAYECIKSAQRAGGIVVYIDTENATELGNLASVGIDVSKRFIFVQKNCIEDIFEIIESSIVKARNLTKDVPVLIVWDSIAQSSPKAELEGDYDQNTIGLAARVYGKGFRKVVNMIGDNKVTLLLINQQRQKIGVMFQDPTCVSPDTKIKIRKKDVETVTFAQLLNRVGINNFSNPLEVDMTDDEYEIESWDEKTNQIVWKPISSLIVKPSVEKYYKLGSLKGTSVHRVLYKGEWIELQNHPDAILVKEPMEVVDMAVEDTETYLAEGQINHNTTPGGMAIPYACSVRLQVGEPRQIKKSINGKEEVIGVLVYCKTIKNKVARPWRKVEFEIHFGKGIVEDEPLLSELMTYMKRVDKIITSDGKYEIRMNEGGAWKYFSVSDAKTGEIIHDLKFTKSAVKEKLFDVPEYKPFVKEVMDACFVIKPEAVEHATLVQEETT